MDINKIISLVAVKIVTGTVLITFIFISISNLFQNLHLYLGKLPNGEILQLSIFSLLLVSSVMGIFYLLPKKVVEPNTTVNFQSLGVSFFEGFINGILKEANKNLEK